MVPSRRLPDERCWVLAKVKNRLQFALRSATTLSARRQLLPVSENALKRWYQLLPEQRSELNKQMLARQVIPYRRLVRRLSKYPLGRLGGFHVVFFHIPKTGGTTLEHVLAKNYPIDSLQHINAPELDSNPFRSCRNGKLVRVLMGHYELNDVFYQWLNRRTVHITMLRRTRAASSLLLRLHSDERQASALSGRARHGPWTNSCSPIELTSKTMLRHTAS